ncbi:MAG: hypothetical protein HRT70_09815 [Flavobacteriaceae bacterium]|nr:hypothetical protein [Flavobacteriaceae bacterium]
MDDESEFAAGLVKEPAIVTVKDFKETVPTIILEPAQSDDDKLTVIDVQKSLLEVILPTSEELKLLAHIRQNTDGGDVAVIMTNRLPQSGTNTHAHLVSVEKRYRKGEGFDWSAESLDNDYIRLVSLKSWSFASLQRYKLTTKSLQKIVKNNVLESSIIDKICPHVPSPLYEKQEVFEAAMENILSEEEDTGDLIAKIRPYARYSHGFDQLVEDLNTKSLALDNVASFKDFYDKWEVHKGSSQTSAQQMWEYLLHTGWLKSASYRAQIPDNQTSSKFTDPEFADLEDVVVRVLNQVKTKSDIVTYTDFSAAWSNSGVTVDAKAIWHYLLNPSIGWLLCDAHITGVPQRKVETFFGSKFVNLEAPTETILEELKDRLVNKLLSRGYTALPHQLRQCDRTYSWYKGPLSPVQQDTKFDSFDTLPDFSDALTQYYPSKGMFNVSYAAAFQLGRLLALQDVSFVRQIRQWKHTLNLQYSKSIAQSEVDHLLGLNNNTVVDSITTETIKNWMTNKLYLKDIPFNYLVSDVNLLPEESIRFFKLDKHWIECLQYGAFTIGGAFRFAQEISPADQKGIELQRFKKISTVYDSTQE